MAKRQAKEEEFAIQPLETRQIELYILGTSPMIQNRLPKKAREQLLLPPRATNKAARELTQKHNPPEEYRDSVYRCRDPKAPTMVHIPTGAFKKAMAQAALDIPGATKAEIGRLVSVLSPTVYLYGKPYLYMAVVRQAGINRTPDIRTRAIFPQWCCKILVRYVVGKIRQTDIVNLNSAAGIITGIGDGRTEKGTFDFGQWEIVNQDDKRWHEIANQGRAVQIAALNDPECFDEDTEELFAWYEVEIKRREADRGKAKEPADAALATQSRKRNGRGRGRAKEETHAS
jgi:hypothetical protein